MALIHCFCSWIQFGKLALFLLITDDRTSPAESGGRPIRSADPVLGCHCRPQHDLQWHVNGVSCQTFKHLNWIHDLCLVVQIKYLNWSVLNTWSLPSIFSEGMVVVAVVLHCHCHSLMDRPGFHIMTQWPQTWKWQMPGRWV
jgi:hypothetical protein